MQQFIVLIPVQKMGTKFEKLEQNYLNQDLNNQLEPHNFFTKTNETIFKTEIW